MECELSIDKDLRNSSVEAHGYLLGTMFFFGTAFTSSKVVVGEIPHQVAAVLRFGGGAVILLVMLAVVSRRSGERFGFSWREVSRAGLIGLIGVFGYNLFFFWGLSLAPSVDGSIIVPVLSPVLTTIMLLVTRQESASTPRIVGLTLGLAGAALFFVGAGGGGLSGSRLTGDLIFLLGATCWATYSIASKKLLGGMNPLRATTFGTCAGALALLVFAIPSVPSVHWGSVSGGTWLNVLYLAIGPTAVAYLFFYRGLRTVSPSTATVLMFTVPVFGVTSSVIFLGESFTGLQIVGTLVMLVGALLAVTQGRFVQRRSAPAQLPAQRTQSEPVEQLR